MIWMRRGLFAGSLVLGVGSLALGLGFGCSNQVEDTGGGTSGAGGKGGTSGTTSECKPTDPLCYGNRPPTSPGNECMAVRDNSTATDKHVQMRQTWFRNAAPAGNTIDIVYSILTQRAELTLPTCNMPNGHSGYIQLIDWDMSNTTDITQQTLRTGYSTFVADEAASKTAITDGLCMAELSYPGYLAAGQTTSAFVYAPTPLPAGRGMSLPFAAAPTLSHRVADQAALDAKKPTLAQGEGAYWVDSATHTVHGYATLAYVVIWSSATTYIVIPVHQVEQHSRFNDSQMNCAGAYRDDRLTLAASCASALQTNPPWGCASDTDKVPGTNETCAPGLGPNYTQGYFLITELEQIYSTDLQSTLCVSTPGADKSAADGWSVTEPTTNGKWCRGSSKWDPSLANDAGLPMGDWCSTTNSAATATCHDAYVSKAYGTGQAFPVKAGTCAQ